jgi:hypothetical protein
MRFEGKFSDVYISNTKGFVGEYAYGAQTPTHPSIGNEKDAM